VVETPVGKKPRFARLAWLAAPLLLLLICCGIYWRLTLSAEYTWIDSPDLVRMEVPRFQFQALRWHHAAFPLWDPHQWCGQPFLGQIVGAANPLNWPFFWLPLGGGGRVKLEVLHWYYVMIHFLGGLFMYWLCRDLRRSRTAALAGAIVFAFGGFFASAPWPEVMAGYVWIPLVFLFLLRALRCYRPTASAALCGLFLGAAWLSGHHEIPTYLSLAVAAVWIYRIASHPADRSRLLRLAALALLIAVLVSGFQTVPGYEYAQRARRWAGADHPLAWGETIPYSVDTAYSYSPGALVNLFVPYLAASTSDYLGVVAIVLALLGVAACWKERPVPLFTTIALCGLLFAMGTYNVFHGMAYAVVPLFGKARVPVRLLALFAFAAAPLAAYGLDAVFAQRAPRAVQRVAIAMAALGGGIYAVAIAAGEIHQYVPGEHVMFAGLMALLLAAVLVAWQRGAVHARLAAIAILALMLMELGFTNAGFSERTAGHGASVTELTAYDDIARYVRPQPELVRVYFADNFNFGDWEGIDSLTGFGAGVTSNMLQIEWWRPRVQDLLGVTYTIAKKPSRPDQVLVFQGSSGLNVYRNPLAFPRVWTVHQVMLLQKPDQLRAAMADPAVDLHSIAPTLEPIPPLETCAAPDQAWMTGRNAGSVTFQARMNCRGLLVIADTWCPGWSATVDGHPVPIYQPYGALRGVVVGPGSHTVAMHYRPRSALLGALMTGTGILLACVLAAIKRPAPGTETPARSPE